METKPEIKCEGLGYSIGQKSILKDLNAVFTSGNCYGVIGANGSGKSTLLRLLSGINAPDSKEQLSRSLGESFYQKQAYIPTYTKPAFDMSVRQVFEASLHQSQNLSSVPDILEKAAQEMQDLSLNFDLSSSFSSLSSGEQKITLLLKALATEPQVLLLDEWEANLDLKYMGLFLQKLKEYQREDRLIICAMHDINAAWQLCDQFVLLKNSAAAKQLSKHDLKTFGGLGEEVYGFKGRIILGTDSAQIEF